MAQRGADGAAPTGTAVGAAAAPFAVATPALDSMLTRFYQRAAVEAGASSAAVAASAAGGSPRPPERRDEFSARHESSERDAAAVRPSPAQPGSAPTVRVMIMMPPTFALPFASFFRFASFLLLFFVLLGRLALFVFVLNFVR